MIDRATNDPSSGLQSVGSLLHQRDGRLMRELARQPGGFGLGQVPVRTRPDATTTMVCGYCSTGCGLNVHIQDGQATALTPATPYPVNQGMACPKGWEALEVLAADDRATTPLLRNTRGTLETVDWNRALDVFVDRFQSIQAKQGAESVAFLSTGQIATEEMAFLGALAKFGMGVRHGDGNTRQCMASAVVAYKQSFGFDAPPYTYRDLEESDVLVFVGANPCIAHPILWQRVLGNPNHPEVIVVDPRRTETAMAATRHLAPTPKSDLTLFYGLARILIERDWIDRTFLDAHTNGFAEFARFVDAFTPERVAAETDITVEQLDALARTIHEGQRVSFWWTMGVNQSHQGVRTAQALINLALLTGNIGRPGTGANSITGQCNAMGSRLFSNTTSLLGGREFSDADDRRKVAETLGIDEGHIPRDAGRSYDKILQSILDGKIKGLWVVGTNPAHSWINQNQFRDILDRLDFLVVQDMYHSTETAQRADLVLPAAGWGEKEGTFINSERRIGLLKRVSKAPGEALADFHIFRLIADRWGCGSMFEKWTSPETVFQILKDLTQGQPCDISGIEDYADIDRAGGIQWPCPADDVPQAVERRLFEDGRFYHADGRARFLFDEPRPLPEQVNERYPFLLLTGRGTAAQWHTQTRTSKSAVLRKLYPRRVYVEINPADARKLGIGPDESVRVESQRGGIRARVFVTPTIPPGQLFVPMHYESANQLTDAVFDPISKQPAYKACAVRVRHDG